jgi:hypothetical protein
LLGQASWLRQGSQQVGQVRIIAKGFADVGEPVGIARAENEASAELEWVLAQAMLANANGFCAFPGTRVIGAKKMKQVGIFQRDGFVRFALIVEEEREGDTGLLAEVAGVARVAEAYGDQFGATLLELVFVLAQPRDVLAAENSAIVAKKDDHGRGIGPERSQPYRFPVNVGQCDVCELAAVLSSHGQLFSRPRGMSVNTEPRFIAGVRCARLP